MTEMEGIGRLLPFANGPDFDGKFCESHLPFCNFIWPPLFLPTRFSCQHKIGFEQLRTLNLHVVFRSHGSILIGLQEDYISQT